MRLDRLLSVATISATLASVLGQHAAVDAACCYFAAKDKDVNQPGQKAFISWSPKEKLEAFTVQPRFEGNAVDFGMVIPTPARPKLDEMPRDFFKDLAMFTILMPMPEVINSPANPVPATMRFEFGSMDTMRRGGVLHRKVTVLESGIVGSLDYKIIVADDASGLFEWLKSNKYSYGGDEETLQYYIKRKWFFTVMKIDPKQMKTAANGTYKGEVTPTRFTFKSSECVYPLKITQLSVKNKTDALFYVQAPSEMDMQADWSWMHSYRPMYLTYMLGCSADAQQQQELKECTNWLNAKRSSQKNYETTKLEWAKQLQETDLNVLDNPEKNYGQTGAGDLPKGAKIITLKDFLQAMEAECLAKNKQLNNYEKSELAKMEDRYQPAKGQLIAYPYNSPASSPASSPGSTPGSAVVTRYAWYANREAPLEDIKGLTRLKGHLKKGQWLTKFRKNISKGEMTHDLTLAEVPAQKQQSYIRIMPTSPP